VTQLTAELKAENRALNQIRVFVENAFGDIKHYQLGSSFSQSQTWL